MLEPGSLLHSMCLAGSTSCSTLAVWAAMQWLAQDSSQPCPLCQSTCQGYTINSTLAVWAAAQRLLLPSCLQRQSWTQHSKLPVNFRKGWGFNFETLLLHVHWQPGTLQQQVPDILSRTGRKPDSVTWSCRPGFTVFFLAQDCNAQCRSLLASMKYTCLQKESIFSWSLSKPMLGSGANQHIFLKLV